MSSTKALSRKSEGPRCGDRSCLALTALVGSRATRRKAQKSVVPWTFVRNPDHPGHGRSGPLESPHQSVEPGCGFVEAFEHVDLAVLADKRDGESVAVRMKADAPGQDGVRRRIQRSKLLLDARFFLLSRPAAERGLAVSGTRQD